MSDSKNTPPSIDDLISNGLSNDDANINLDEFNLDNLNLDNLDSMLDKAPKATDKPVLSPDDDVSLDLDFGSPADKIGGRADTSTDILDELDALSQSQAESGGLFGSSSSNASLSELLQEPNLPSMTTASDDLLVSPTLEDDKSMVGSDVSLGAKDETPLAAITPKPAKKSLFGGSGKSKAKRAARPPKSGSNGDSKQLTTIILGALIALLVIVGGWFFFLSSNSTEQAPQPVAEQQAPAESAPAEPAPTEPAPEMTDGVAVADGTMPDMPPADGTNPAPVGLPDTSAIDMAAANAGTAAPATPPATAPAEQAAPMPTGDNTQVIDVKSITGGNIPEDPALIKEEIDRLNDKDGQLEEQAKLINEQLVLMQDLTKQKEEQIALLEAQIAQLEKEKQGK